MIRIRACCLLFCAAFFAGCASDGSFDGAARPDPAALSAIDWVALAGNWTGPSEYRVELVTFSDLRTGRSHLVRYDIQLSRKGLVMVAQTPLGVPLYQTSVAAGAVETIHHTEQLKDLPVERALADFVLAHWPLDELTAAARGAGYTLLEREGGRQLLDSTGRHVVEIRPASASADNMIEVIHHDIPLELIIHTVEQTAGHTAGGGASGTRP